MPRKLYGGPGFSDSQITAYNVDKNIGQACIPPDDLLIENVEAGEQFSYVFDAGNATHWEWGVLPTGVTVDPNDTRKIQGTFPESGLFAMSCTVLNHTGAEVTGIVNAIIDDPANMFSTVFSINEYCDATADSGNPLYRTADSVAAGTPWTLVLWFKPGTSNNSEQTMLAFGGDSHNTEGRIQLFYNGSNDNLTFHYGSSSSNLKMTTPVMGLSDETWHHVLISYDGGQTGPSEPVLANRFAAFRVFINGNETTTTDAASGNGFDGEIVPDLFRLGQNAGNGGSHLRDGFNLDQIGIWNASLGTPAVDTLLFAGGRAVDYSALAVDQPEHWYKMGDDLDVFPTLQDYGTIGTRDMTMNGMVAGNIVADVP